MNILILRVLFQLSSQKNIPREMIIKIYQYLLSDPVSDGGRSNMLLKLVSTYGIVPEKIFRNTPTSVKTRQFDYLIKEI